MEFPNVNYIDLNTYEVCCLQLQRRAEHMKKSLEQQQKELDEKWKIFEKEKAQWEESTGLSKGSQENIKE